jgi:hypothetical protein
MSTAGARLGVLEARAEVDVDVSGDEFDSREALREVRRAAERAAQIVARHLAGSADELARAGELLRHALRVLEAVEGSAQDPATPPTAE